MPHCNIGILSQECCETDVIARECRTALDYESYIAASYVKYVEMAGARVVPILIDQPESYYADIFRCINGLLLPGGNRDLMTSRYAAAANILYAMALAANESGDYFPIWGTCQGFQMMCVMATKERAILTETSTIGSDNKGVNLNWDLSNEFHSSKLFGKHSRFTKEMENYVVGTKSTFHSHVWSVLLDDFNQHECLSNLYNILVTNTDENGKKFASVIEGKKFPFYGVIFHPEKSMFEWKSTIVDHSTQAIEVSQFLANFFVSECKLNNHTVGSAKEEATILVYNYNAIIDQRFNTYEQVYIFDLKE